MGSINDFIKNQKPPAEEHQEWKVGSSEPKERKSIIITHEFQQFLDLVSVYKEKNKYDWPDLCQAALKKADEEPIIEGLDAVNKSNTERALRLCNVVVDSHRKTRINFAMPTVRVRKIIAIPEEVHEALARKPLPAASRCTFSCNLRGEVYLRGRS